MNLEYQSPSAAHWPLKQYQGLFATGDDHQSEQVVLVAEAEPTTQPETTTSPAPQILAFLVARRVEQEWELENIVVAETARRRGVGTHLLSEFVAHTRAQNGRAIFLEVRESNQSARALYRKVGFEETGLRKSYYAGPPEHAILYRLRLC